MFSVGKTIGPNPVKPANQLGRSITPKNRIDKHNGVGGIDLCLFRSHVIRYQRLPPVITLPEIFGLAHIGFEPHLIKIGNTITMAGTFKSPDKTIPHITGTGILRRMGIYDEDPHGKTIPLPVLLEKRIIDGIVVSEQRQYRP
jgi:hypothetical protein